VAWKVCAVSGPAPSGSTVVKLCGAPFSKATLPDRKKKPSKARAIVPAARNSGPVESRTK
jgi:hypothetical protein